MSILGNSRKGAMKKPKIFMIYGGNDCWKTTQLASMPNAYIIAIEDNNDHIEHGTISDTLKTYEELANVIQALTTEDHQYQNVGIDSLTAVDLLIRDKVLRDNRAKTIKDIPYGGGAKAIEDTWYAFYKSISNLSTSRGINVGCLAQQVKSEEPMPDGSKVEKFMPNISKTGLEVFKDNSKGIFYVKKDLYLKKEDGGFGKTTYRANGSGGVVLFTQGEHFLVKIAKSPSQNIPVSMEFNLNYLLDMWINPENHVSEQEAK